MQPVTRNKVLRITTSIISVLLWFYFFLMTLPVFFFRAGSYVLPAIAFIIGVYPIITIYIWKRQLRWRWLAMIVTFLAWVYFMSLLP